MEITTRFSDPLQLLDAAQLDQLTQQAADAPRKRAHLLLHSGPDDPVQRLLIAAQPGTYVRPHHHSQQWEMLVRLRGRLDILTFDSEGAVLSREALQQTAPVVQIPIGRWHGCVVRAPDTLIMEVKPGPYRPNEFADWAPEEGHRQAAALVHWMEDAKIGQTWQPSS